jgi:hypothetical protein
MKHIKMFEEFDNFSLDSMYRDYKPKQEPNPKSIIPDWLKLPSKSVNKVEPEVEPIESEVKQEVKPEYEIISAFMIGGKPDVVFYYNDKVYKWDGKSVKGEDNNPEICNMLNDYLTNHKEEIKFTRI